MVIKINKLSYNINMMNQRFKLNNFRNFLAINNRIRILIQRKLKFNKIKMKILK